MVKAMVLRSFFRQRRYLGRHQPDFGKLYQKCRSPSEVCRLHGGFFAS